MVRFKRVEGLKKFEVDIGTLISNEEAEEKVRSKKKAEEKEAEMNKVRAPN